MLPLHYPGMTAAKPLVNTARLTLGEADGHRLPVGNQCPYGWDFSTSRDTLQERLFSVRTRQRGEGFGLKWGCRQGRLPPVGQETVGQETVGRGAGRRGAGVGGRAWGGERGLADAREFEFIPAQVRE